MKRQVLNHYAIVGAGALGTILAVLLSRAGHRVSLLARGARAEQIKNHGLAINGLVDASARCEVLDNPQQLGAADVLIYTTKTYHLQAALATLKHVDVNRVFAVANGVSKSAFLADTHGAASVLGCVADFSGELTDDGTVLYTRNNGLYLGELDGSDSARLRQIASETGDSGLKTIAVNNIVSEEWSKFVAWVPVLLLAILTRARTGRYLSDCDCAHFAVSLIKEVAALADSQKIPLMDRSLLPAATISSLPVDKAVACIVDIGAQMIDSAPKHKMSGLQDLENGRSLEIHETIGYALQLAEQKGIAMPMTQAAFYLAAGVDRMQG